MEDGIGCVSVLVFLGTWIVCTVAFGAIGFLLGWAPGLVLAVIWPLILALGVFLVVIAILIAAALFLWFYLF